MAKLLPSQVILKSRAHIKNDQLKIGKRVYKTCYPTKNGVITEIKKNGVYGSPNIVVTYTSGRKSEPMSYDYWSDFDEYLELCVKVAVQGQQLKHEFDESEEKLRSKGKLPK